MAVARIQTNLEENLQNEILGALNEALKTARSPEEMSTMINDRLSLNYL